MIGESPSLLSQRRAQRSLLAGERSRRWELRLRLNGLIEPGREL